MQRPPAWPVAASSTALAVDPRVETFFLAELQFSLFFSGLVLLVKKDVNTFGRVLAARFSPGAIVGISPLISLYFGKKKSLYTVFRDFPTKLLQYVS